MIRCEKMNFRASKGHIFLPDIPEPGLYLISMKPCGLTPGGLKFLVLEIMGYENFYRSGSSCGF
jgi:hypothetical protein